MKAYFEIQDLSHTSIYSVWKVAHSTLLSDSHTVKAIEIFKQSDMQQESESPYKVVLYLKNKDDLLPLRNIVIIALRRGTEISREHHCYDIDQLEEKHSRLTLEGNIEHILNMLSKNGILSDESIYLVNNTATWVCLSSSSFFCEAVEGAEDSPNPVRERIINELFIHNILPTAQRLIVVFSVTLYCLRERNQCWPHFKWDTTALEELELQFLHQSGVFLGAACILAFEITGTRKEYFPTFGLSL